MKKWASIGNTKTHHSSFTTFIENKTEVINHINNRCILFFIFIFCFIFIFFWLLYLRFYQLNKFLIILHYTFQHCILNILSFKLNITFQKLIYSPKIYHFTYFFKYLLVFSFLKWLVFLSGWLINFQAFQNKFQYINFIVFEIKTKIRNLITK